MSENKLTVAGLNTKLRKIRECSKSRELPSHLTEIADALSKFKVSDQELHLFKKHIDDELKDKGIPC